MLLMYAQVVTLSADETPTFTVPDHTKVGLFWLLKGECKLVFNVKKSLQRSPVISKSPRRSRQGTRSRLNKSSVEQYAEKPAVRLEDCEVFNDSMSVDSDLAESEYSTVKIPFFEKSALSDATLEQMKCIDYHNLFAADYMRRKEAGLTKARSIKPTYNSFKDTLTSIETASASAVLFYVPFEFYVNALDAFSKD